MFTVRKSALHAVAEAVPTSRSALSVAPHCFRGKVFMQFTQTSSRSGGGDSIFRTERRCRITSAHIWGSSYLRLPNCEGTSGPLYRSCWHHGTQCYITDFWNTFIEVSCLFSYRCSRMRMSSKAAKGFSGRIPHSSFLASRQILPRTSVLGVYEPKRMPLPLSPAIWTKYWGRKNRDLVSMAVYSD